MTETSAAMSAVGNKLVFTTNQAITAGRDPDFGRFPH